MIRHQFSYWMTVQGPTMDFSDFYPKFRQSLSDEGCLYPDGPFWLVPEKKDGKITVTAHVYPDLGTVEEQSDLVDKIEKIAALYPDCSIQFTELDEEDKSIGVMYRFTGGKKVLEQRSRLVPCYKKYDNITVSAIADMLTAAGHGAAADLVITNFKDV